MARVNGGIEQRGTENLDGKFRGGGFLVYPVESNGELS